MRILESVAGTPHGPDGTGADPARRPGPGAGAPVGSPSGPGHRSLLRRLAVATQRRRWQQHAGGWEDHAVTGLGAVVDAVVARTGSSPLGVVVDVGSGGGALAVPLAERAQEIIAVDVSPTMLEKLGARAEEAGLENIETRCQPVEALDFPPGSVDVMVSNYALHHLLDADKRQFVANAATWLRPGGRLVIGDMMIGRGMRGEDRRILAGKVRVLIARGPAGWWRIAKNAWRLYSRTVERPLPMEAWAEQLRRAGFTDVRADRVVAEAGVVSGVRPAPAPVGPGPGR